MKVKCRVQGNMNHTACWQVNMQLTRHGSLLNENQVYAALFRTASRSSMLGRVRRTKANSRVRLSPRLVVSVRVPLVEPHRANRR